MKNRGLLCSVLSLFLCGVSLARAEVSYTGKDLRDPFMEPVSAEPKQDDTEDIYTMLQSLTLQGVLLSPDKPQAIIDGKILRVGNRVGSSATIVNIEKDGVTFEAKGTKFVLRQPVKEKAHEAQSATT